MPIFIGMAKRSKMSSPPSARAYSIKDAAKCAGIMLVVLCSAMLIFRTLFFIYLNPGSFSFGELAYVLLHGIMFDLAESAFILAIFLIFSFVFGQGAKCWPAIIVCAVLFNIMLVVHVLDFWYFKVMERRLDYLFVIYLPMVKYFLPSVAAEVNAQNFFIWPILACLLSVGLFFGIHRRYNLSQLSRVTRRMRIGVVLILLFLSYSYIFSFDHSRCDSKEFRDIAALSPIVTLQHSFYKEKKRELLYAAHHKGWKPGGKGEVDTTEFGINVDVLKKLHGIAIAADSVDAGFPLVRRHVINRKHPVLQKIHRNLADRSPPNIVIIMVESLCATDVRSWYRKAPVDATPVIDSLCRRGIKLSKYYTTNGFTINALISVLASAYPRQGVGVSGTDLMPYMLSISDILKGEGYETAYMKCGSIKFENVDRFTELHNFKTILGLEDFPEGSERIGYGLADHVVYRHGAEWMNQHRDQPTFLVLASLVNHHPWEVPGPQYEYYDSTMRYHNVYNAIRYSDWAVGDFIQKCEENGLADNTIFIIMADHTADWKYRMEVKNVVNTKTKARQIWIPCFFYNPSIIPEKVNYDFITSHMDMAPTILDMLNLEPETPYLGRSIFANVSPDARFNVYVGPWADYQLAVVSRRGYYRISLDGRYVRGADEPVSIEDMKFLEEVKHAIFGFNALLNSRMLWDGTRNMLKLCMLAADE